MAIQTQRFPRVLAVDMAGLPIGWLGMKETVHQYVHDRVAWHVGEVSAVVRGGMNRLGKRTELDVHPIIAVRGANAARINSDVPPLNNDTLFARDNHTCLYCGQRYGKRYLSWDHIRPRSQGGEDSWSNSATSCLPCNNRKAARTPEQAGMPLLAVPYEPNYAETLILSNRHILADQKQFLAVQLPRRRRPAG